MDFKLNTVSVILIVLSGVLLLLITYLCERKSVKPVKKSKLTNIQSESVTPQNIKDDSVLIFHAPWCGHCKRSMGDFKAASEMSNGKVVLINSDDPSNKPLIEKYNVKGFPTILKASGEVFNGQRTKDAIVSFANA